jgi:hypothetical protein
MLEDVGWVSAARVLARVFSGRSARNPTRHGPRLLGYARIKRRRTTSALGRANPTYGAAFLLALSCTLTSAPGVVADDALISRVLTTLGADRADVRACIAEQMTVAPERHAEVTRLGDVAGWIERAVTLPKASGNAQIVAMGHATSDAFVDIVATFNHERRLDGGRLAFITNGQLGPPHVTAYARVTRALGAGHDAKKVFCGT